MDERTSIPLKEEDIQEIMARQYAISAIEQKYGNLLLEVQQHDSCVLWLQQTVKQAESRNIPVSHEEYRERMEAWTFFERGSRTFKDEAEQTRKIVEFLKESLTFFLAEKYSFDPLGEPWMLSFEEKLLRRPPGKDAL